MFSEERDMPVGYSGIVWVDEPYIMFSLAASDIDEARAMAAARFGAYRQITVYKKEPPVVIEGITPMKPVPPGEDDPFQEYFGKLWVDGKPVLQFSVMARSADEARILAEARYGKHPMSVWSEEDAHAPR